MSILKKILQSVQYPFKALQQIIQYILAAVLRIFSPDSDQYPATGVQPFEGESVDRKKVNREWFW